MVTKTELYKPYDKTKSGVRPLNEPKPCTKKELEFLKRTVQKLFSRDNFTHSDLVQALYVAYFEARKRKRGTLDEIRFEFDLAANIENLARSIEDRTYEPSRSIAFMISRPVTREIFAAPFRDRVVHHLLYMLDAEWWDRRLVGNASSCRVGKGTLYGVRHLRKDMRACSKMGRIPCFVQKLDISGYFMSLNRKLLFKRVQLGLNEQFKNERRIRSMTEFLWEKIIFDDPTVGVTIRGDPRDWRKIPREKTLLLRKDGTGIVIGNLTSQLLSNVFLDQIDRFIRYVLGYKYYGRYVDDFYIIMTALERERFLEKDLPRIREFLKSIGLRLHKHKCYGQPVEHGVEFLGSVVYLRHIQPGRRIMRNYSRLVHDLVNRKSNRWEAVNSYEGLLKHMQGKKKKLRMYRRLGFKSF